MEIEQLVEEQQGRRVLGVQKVEGTVPFDRASTVNKSIARRLTKALGELGGETSTDWAEEVEAEEVAYADDETDTDLSVEEWSTTDDSDFDGDDEYVEINDSPQLMSGEELSPKREPSLEDTEVVSLCFLFTFFFTPCVSHKFFPLLLLF